ncbi:metallophosphoesterase [Candidatus Stoquefichus massiliensis]|uniref:metallophosphoesterase n=1 Tax=Candidatus Stoquefichus massiliensis TaxID=1470350 RepID=UPI0004B4E903|nr:metallophosphoesterase [Candidatus Stoquefichus massiliensis]
MKVLYVTDLHGDKNKYNKILEVSIKEDIKVIINGGDMLPKQCNRHKEQPLFMNNFLKDYFIQLQKHHITYLAMLGNDDLLAFDDLFEELCSQFDNVYNIANKKILFMNMSLLE